MTQTQSPGDVVLALVRVINGEAPRRAADDILDPTVDIHMDAANHRGIDIWYKWVHLVRNCGRIAELRMTRCRVESDVKSPDIVHLTARWTGIIRSQHQYGVAKRDARLSYLVRDGRIREIWTHKSNYEFVFGRWIRYSICYRLFLAWAIVHFATMSLRGKDLSVDTVAVLNRGPP